MFFHLKGHFLESLSSLSGFLRIDANVVPGNWKSTQLAYNITEPEYEKSAEKKNRLSDTRSLENILIWLQIDAALSKPLVLRVTLNYSHFFGQEEGIW